MEQTLKFTEEQVEYSFSVDEQSPLLTVKKIVINSLYGEKPNIWGGKLYSLKPALEIRFNRSFQGISGLIKEELDIETHNSPLYRNPVFPMDVKFPSPFEIEAHKVDTRGIYECIIKLTYEKLPDLKPDISVLLETTPGMVLRAFHPRTVK